MLRPYAYLPVLLESCVADPTSGPGGVYTRATQSRAVEQLQHTRHPLPCPCPQHLYSVEG